MHLQDGAAVGPAEGAVQGKGHTHAPFHRDRGTLCVGAWLGIGEAEKIMPKSLSFRQRQTAGTDTFKQGEHRWYFLHLS